MTTEATQTGTLRQIPSAIWVLGFVSLLMDVSSEMIHSLLPMFMVTTLGASAVMVGLVEGGAEATALIVKVFSGALSDYLGKRKGLAVLGYALGAISKPLFAMASTSGLVLGARLADRIGKGIRRAPRSWPTSRRRTCAGPHSACANRSIPSAHSWARCWLSA